MFNEKMEEQYFFSKANNGIVSCCLICYESVAVLKECNFCHHYDTKYRLKYSSIVQCDILSVSSALPSFLCHRNFFVRIVR